MGAAPETGRPFRCPGSLTPAGSEDNLRKNDAGATRLVVAATRGPGREPKGVGDASRRRLTSG